MFKQLACSFLILFVWAFFPFANGVSSTGLQTVQHVDLPRFMGTWYEIARLETPWDRGCYHNPLFIYTQKPDGSIHVISQCQKDNFFQTIQRAEGTAEIIDKKTNAKWKIELKPSERYKGVPNGDYWIIQLADDYSYAAISEPTETFFWVISRTPSLPQDIFKGILDKAVLQLPNINVLNVLKTQQDSAGPNPQTTPP